MGGSPLWGTRSPHPMIALTPLIVHRGFHIESIQCVTVKDQIMRFCVNGLNETSCGYERTIGVSNRTPTMMEGLGLGFNSNCKAIHGLAAAPTGGLQSSTEGAETERGDGCLHELEGGEGVERYKLQVLGRAVCPARPLCLGWIEPHFGLRAARQC